MPSFSSLRGLLKPKRKSTRRTKTRRLRMMEPLEDRRLLANLNFAAGGLVIYGGGGTIDNNLSISVAGDTYTYTDTAETINLIGTNVPTTNSGTGTNTVTFDASTAPVGLTRLIVNTNAGNDVVSISGMRGGAEGLEIRDTGSADTVNITGSLGTAGNRIGVYGANIAASQINLGGDIFTNNLAIALGAAASGTPVALSGNSEVDAGTATVEVNSGGAGISGAGVNLTIDGGSVQLRGDVALTGASDISLNATNLLQVGQTGATGAVSSGSGSVSLTGGTQVALTNSVTTTGAVTITSPTTTMSNAAGTISGSSVTVSAALTNTSANTTDIDATAGNVSIGGQLSSNTLVDVDATGNANFDGSVAATDIDVTAATVNAVSFQASAGDVNISGPTTFDGVGAVLISSTGDVTFDSTVTGNASNLTLQAPDLVDVDGAITNVATLNVNGGGVTLTSAQLADATAQSIIVNATGIGLSGDLAATSGTGGTVNLTGAVTVSGDPRSITSGGDAAENIVINGSINPTVADTTNLTLNAGTLGNLQVTGATGGTLSFASVTLRGDVVTMGAIDVDGDLTVNGGDIRLTGAVTGDGSGTATFAPAVPGNTLDIFNNPAHTRIGTNTRIASDTLANIAGGAFADFQFGDAATGVITVNPDSNNSLPLGALTLDTPTEFEAGAIIVSEDLNNGANTVTFETDNLAVFRSVIGSGDVDINKKTAGGTLELRGDIGARGTWGANALTINAVGATVNAPAAGAALPVLGLGATQPAVNLGGTKLTEFNVNADTLNALAPTAIQSGGDLILAVDTLNLTGGLQTAGAGTVTIGNLGAAVENIGGAPLSILLAAGTDMLLASYDGNGGALAIRGVGGQLGTVTLGTISDTGALSIGTSGSNDATLLNINGNINAAGIVLRGDSIATGNMGAVTLTSTSATGNVQLSGPVTLFDDTSLINTTSPATGFVRVDGTINGGFDLVANAGVGSVVFSQTVGGLTPLNGMTVTSGGLNYVTVPISVANGFSWIVGVLGNGINDRIIRAGAGSITSTNGPITLEADVLQGITSGVNVIGPGQTLTQRGAGN